MSTPHTTVGGRLREARKSAGMSADDAMVALRQLLPKPYWVTSANITKIERGDITPNKLDVAFLAALCESYGKNLTEVLPEYAEASEAVIHLLNRNSARKFTLERRKENRGTPKGGSRVVTHLDTGGYPRRQATGTRSADLLHARRAA